MDSMPFLRVDLGPVGLWGGPGKWGVSKKSELAPTLVFLSFCSRHVLLDSLFTIMVSHPVSRIQFYASCSDHRKMGATRGAGLTFVSGLLGPGKSPESLSRACF